MKKKGSERFFVSIKENARFHCLFRVITFIFLSDSTISSTLSGQLIFEVADYGSLLLPKDLAYIISISTIFILNVFISFVSISIWIFLKFKSHDGVMNAWKILSIFGLVRIIFEIISIAEYNYKETISDLCHPMKEDNPKFSLCTAQDHFDIYNIISFCVQTVLTLIIMIIYCKL
jgi:hypothetical protein